MLPLVVLLLIIGLTFIAKASAKRPHHHKRHGHSQRYLTAMRLNHGLRGSPMAHLGFELEAAGWHYHVSPYFMAAVAGTESSLGAAACPSNHFNVWGISSCSWSPAAFTSWHNAIQWYATFLKSHWPSARTPYGFYGYAACSSCWGARTAYFMRALFGVGPSVGYP